MPTNAERIKEALAVLAGLGLPRPQLNERSALCLLALLDLPADRSWSEATAPLRGITPIMDWIRKHYGKDYAPNTRETVRRQTMHQFVSAGIALYNPDDPGRAVNSPHAVYQIEPTCLELLKQYGTREYERAREVFVGSLGSLALKYAMHREMRMVPISIGEGKTVSLSPGAHSELIKAIVEEFAPRFVPGGELIYAGDTGEKWGYFNEELLATLGAEIGGHGKMPDAAIYFRERDWLILAEAVTSHGPVDAKRRGELQHLFRKTKAGLVFVSAFPDRRTFSKYADAISWETEVWVADNPTHLIHFNGVRFLGPYP